MFSLNVTKPRGYKVSCPPKCHLLWHCKWHSDHWPYLSLLSSEIKGTMMSQILNTLTVVWRCIGRFSLLFHYILMGIYNTQEPNSHLYLSEKVLALMYLSLQYPHSHDYGKSSVKQMKPLNLKSTVNSNLDDKTIWPWPYDTTQHTSSTWTLFITTQLWASTVSSSAIISKLFNTRMRISSKVIP